MLTGEAGRAMLEELEAQAAPPAEQLELLPPTRFEVGSEEHGRLVEAVRRDRAGRPPGARNLATRDMVALVRRTIGDPFHESARILLHSPATLAAELGCTKLEAFDRLERIRSDLRPFMYARLAPIDASGNAVPPTFAMVFGSSRSSPASSSLEPPWLEDFKQNQALDGAAVPLSHDDVSHGAAK
jgi:hypothetical protein